ncbi:helix-turn-helix domain-containing protein [Natronomonas gomsonensis]|uniref:helix-turn-helix domain-containing protein n=1 Tax=Natronomonas gomsonensis TaxID=1046043 RepID=UPI0015C1C13F|nr:helix-turn-helix domain-containing protein [Natronomonas gomsonensis]
MISECLVVEFRVTGDDCPLAAASRSAEESIEAAPPLRRADGNTLLRFSTVGDAVGDTLDADDRIRYLHRTSVDSRHTFRCLSKDRCVVHELIDEGFLVDSVQYRDGVERHVGAVVGQEVLHGVLEAAGEAVGVKLERISPLGDDGDVSVETRWNLTPGQAAALETAYEMGYFDVPKRVTSAEVAAELDISKSAFLERLRRGQTRLLGSVFA